MKSFKKILTVLATVFLLVTTAFCGSKYAVASGNWNLTSTWSLTRGGSSGAAVPSSSDTVWIPSPYMVTVEASAKTCYNLFVESGGVLITNNNNPSSNQWYVRVYGDSIRNDGIIGYNPSTPTVMTTISFEAYATGKTLTFTGSGITKISRIRPGNNMSNTTVVINQDMTLTYTGSTGTGGSAWYAFQGTGTGNSLKINAGKTLTFVDQASLSTNSSVDTDGPNTTIQVDGTLSMATANSTMSLRPAAGATVSLIVNGTVEVGRTFKPTGTTGVASTITVNSGGLLKLGSVGGGVVYFNTPGQFVSGNGTTQFFGGTMQIGATDGLNSTTGPIRTATRFFSDTAAYEYNGSSIQVTGAELPATIRRLAVSNTNGLTLTNNLTVDTTLSLGANLLNTGSNKVTVGINGSVSRTTGYVVGNFERVFPTGTAISRTFNIGAGGSYTPAIVTFANVTGSGNLTASVVGSDHPNIASSGLASNKSANRYFSFSNNSVTFDSYTDTLFFKSTDLDAGATVNNFNAEKYSASTWSPVTISGRTDTTISFDGQTSFSDFAFGEPKVSLSVLNDGNGSVTKSPDQVIGYDPGSVVSLTPVPNSGYAFLNWTGDVPSGHETDNPLSLTMDANKTLTANFVQVYIITAGVIGNGAITPNGIVSVQSGSDRQFQISPNTGSHFDSLYVDGVKSDSTTTFTFINVVTAHVITAYFSPDQQTVVAVADSNGSVQITPNQATYDYGSTVSLLAVPVTDYAFINWTGDVLSGHETENPLSLIVDGNKSLVAHFAFNIRTINATVEGNGTITPSGDVQVANSTDQRFTFTPNTGYKVDSVLVDGNKVDSTVGYTFVNVVANHTIKAFFSIGSFPVNVSVVGNGSVTKEPNLTDFVYNTDVNLTATASTGWSFANWSGSATGSTNPLIYTVGISNELTATFTINYYQLTINALHGTVNRSPDSTWYAYGTQVTLTPTPDAGYVFSGWSGDVLVGNENDNPLTIHVDSTMVITPNFSPIDYTINVSVVGNGSVTQTPNVPEHAYGSNDTLTALAGTGYHFVAWSGDVISSTNPLIITVNASMNLTATFESNGNVRRTRGLDSTWTSPYSWEYGQVPQLGDSVEILAGDTIKYDASANITSLKIYGGFRPSRAAASSLTVTGDINIYPGAIFMVNSSQAGNYLIHTITVQGNFIDNGSILDCRTGSGTTLNVINFVFSGSGNSTVSVNRPYGASSHEFNGITINKQGTGKVILGSSIFIAGGSTATPEANSVLNMSRGIIESGNYALVHLSTSSATLIGASDSCYVIGAMGRGMSSSGPVSRDFPLGDATGYHPVKVYSATSGAGTGNFIVAREFQANANTGSSVLNGGIDKVSGRRYYKMTYGWVAGAGGSPSTSMDLLNFSPSYTVDDGYRHGNQNLRVAYSTDDRATWTKMDMANTYTTKPDSLPRLIKPADLLTTVHLDSVLQNAAYATLADTGGLNPLDGSVGGYSASKTAIPFGVVNVGSSKLDSVVISNPGGGLTNLNSVVISDSSLEFGVSPAAPVQIPGSGSVKFYVTFHPTSASAKFAYLIISHSAGVKADSILLNGTGVPVYTLTVNATNGTVIKNPDKVEYDENEAVILTATPTLGYSFVGWSGDTTSTDNPITVTMNANKSYTATFAINTYIISTIAYGSGTVTKLPEQPTYNYGDTVTVTATPANGWMFDRWEGDATGNTNPLVFVMTNNKTLMAYFTLEPAYLAAYRTFNPDSIYKSIDNFGKIGKSVKPKPNKAMFSFKLPVDSNNVNGVFVAFSASMDTLADFIVTPLPTMMPDAKSKLTKWNITFATTLNIGDTVTISGWSLKGALEKVTYLWKRNSVNVGKTHTKGAIFTYNTLGLPMPNRLNVVDAAYKKVAGVITPINVGVVKTDKKAYGWVSMTSAMSFYKSLGIIKSKVMYLHDSDGRGFDFFKNGKPFVGKLGTLTPLQQDNKLFAHLAALKLAITSSALSVTPNGFGELLFSDTTVNPLSGLMVKELVKKADTMMTGYPSRTFESQDSYENLFSAVSRINNAFEGLMDTVSFGSSLVLKGTNPLINFPFLKPNPSVTPEKIVAETSDETVPDQFSLEQNYPNPFNPTTTIQFNLPTASNVTLKIFNLLGQEVATVLNNQDLEEGSQDIQFNATNFASGVYLYRITATSVDEDGVTSTFTNVKKMVLVK